MLDTKAQLQELYIGGFLPHCRHLFPNLELVCDAWFCTDNFMVPQPLLYTLLYQHPHRHSDPIHV
jgi:hypothetical protein